MNTPFTSFGYEVTNGTVTRTTPDRLTDVINVLEYGADPTGATTSTAAFRTAICEAFGVCSFVGGTGGVSTTTLTVTAVNYGTIKPNTELVEYGGVVFGTLSASTGKITLTAAIIGGQVIVGQTVQGLGSVSAVSGTSIGDTITITPNPGMTITTPQYFYIIQEYVGGFPSFPSSTGAGGAGTYTLTAPISIPDGTQLWCSNGTNANVGMMNNKPLFIPAGHYDVDQPLILMNLAGIHIYGSGNGTNINYIGNGTEGTTVNLEGSFTPTFLLQGVGYSTIENMQFAMPNNFTQSNVVQLAASSSSAAGSATLTFNSLSDPVTGNTVVPGMQAWSLSNGQAVNGSLVIATNPAAKTVTLRADGLVGTGPINSHSATVSANDTIVFTTQAIGIQMDQSLGKGYCGTNTFRKLSFGLYGRGIYTNGGQGNCDNCTLYDVSFTSCCIAGLQLTGQNVLNWQMHGGGASICGHASTCDPAGNLNSPGNCGAGISLGGSGCEISSPSCSDNTWDVVAIGTQAVTLTGGRGEQNGIAPYMSEFTGYITAGSLTVTSFTRGQPLQPGTTITNVFGGSSMGAPNPGFYYILSGTNPYVIGTLATGTQATGLNYGSSGSPLPMASAGIYRGQSLCTDQFMTVNGWGFGSAVPGITNGESTRALDATFGGTFMLDQFQCPIESGQDGWVAHLGDNGAIMSRGTSISGSGNPKIQGTNNARVFLTHDRYVSGVPSSLFTSFTGTVMEYTPFVNHTVADLTGGNASLTAAARWSRAKIYVTDYSVAWGSGVGAVGTSIAGHGGGTHTVPVICPDGAGWVVGG